MLRGNPTQYGLIVLQNPKPGKIGNLGNNVIKGPALWGLNTNLQKSFKIGESKSLQFRADAFNVTNHPQPGAPNLSINPNLTNGVPIPFGQITARPEGVLCRLNYASSSSSPHPSIREAAEHGGLFCWLQRISETNGVEGLCTRNRKSAILSRRGGFVTARISLDSRKAGAH
jgi:hypothetical protein